MNPRPFRPFRENNYISSGGFFHGDRTSVEGSIGFRFSKHLKAEGQVNYNRISLPVDNGLRRDDGGS